MIKITNNIRPAQKGADHQRARLSQSARRTWLRRFLKRANKRHAPALRRLARGE
jgi:hypothetical protein